MPNTYKLVLTNNKATYKTQNGSVVFVWDRVPAMSVSGFKAMARKELARLNKKK